MTPTRLLTTFVILIVFVSAFTLNVNAQTDTVKLYVHPDSIEILENHPFDGTDVKGTFKEKSNTDYGLVHIKYRGAYTLQSLMQNGAMQRNWKVKFPKLMKYHNRREWNYNYENTLNQILAYTVFKTAGVKVPSPRFVNFYLNDVRHGLYLEFEDVDNSNFLSENFGTQDGELYKAATDQPYPPEKYFADLTYLGNTSQDYYLHYDKKMNTPISSDTDYTSIMRFTAMLNYTPNDEFVRTLNRWLDVPSFIKYLVIANYISFWDGYPQRAKNFWMYQNNITNQWSFVPWDLNDTWHPRGMYDDWINRYGTKASLFIFHDDAHPPTDWKWLQAGEDKFRPLVTRMMKFAEFKNAYILEYKRAIETYLEPNHLYSQIDSLLSNVKVGISATEYNDLVSNSQDIKTYIGSRSGIITPKLNIITLYDTVPVTEYIDPMPIPIEDLFVNISNPKNESGLKFYPNPATNYISLSHLQLQNATIAIYNVVGELVIKHQINSHIIDISSLTQGVYIVKIDNNNSTLQQKLIKK